MTKYNHNVNKSGAEPPSTQGVSISERFVAFVASLPEMISDDRDLAGHHGWDPAIDPWFKAAECSLGRTKALAAAVLVPQPCDAAERALQRVATLFMRAISSACPEEVARMRARCWSAALGLPCACVGRALCMGERADHQDAGCV